MTSMPATANVSTPMVSPGSTSTRIPAATQRTAAAVRARVGASSSRSSLAPARNMPTTSSTIIVPREANGRSVSSAPTTMQATEIRAADHPGSRARTAPGLRRWGVCTRTL
ncbi:MAG: hypothetical protein GX596_03915 [Propionibacterium sp.]|nr:hypothetical protein [Propionibacterium sp.]